MLDALRQAIRRRKLQDELTRTTRRQLIDVGIDPCSIRRDCRKPDLLLLQSIDLDLRQMLASADE